MSKKNELKNIGIPFEFSDIYQTSWSDDWNSRLDIDLTEMVDGYDYHDFPNSVDLFLGKESLIVLRDTINSILEAMDRKELDE